MLHSLVVIVLRSLTLTRPARYGRATSVLRLVQLKGVVSEVFAKVLDAVSIWANDGLGVFHSGSQCWRSEEVNITGTHIAHLETQRTNELRVQPLIDGEERYDRLDRIGDLARAGQRVAAEHRVDDALEIGLLIPCPLVIAVGNRLPFPHERERLLSIELLRALGEVVAARAEGVLAVHGDAPERVREALKPNEVNYGDVIDSQIDEVHDGADHQRNSAERQRGIDLVVPMPFDRNPVIPHERHHVDAVPLRGN